MAIGQLLQPMFDTVDTAHGTFGGGPGEEAWKPMLVQEFAKQIARPWRAGTGQAGLRRDDADAGGQAQMIDAASRRPRNIWRIYWRRRTPR